MGKQTCCFIGHRKIQNQEEVRKKVEEVVRTLIVEKGVEKFNFGSRSEFDALCHAAVMKLKVEYPNIVRINYRCKSEYVVKEEEREELEKSWSEQLHREISLQGFEGEKISDRVFNGGYASYVERNQEMIDDSDICVFYYQEGYTPEPNPYRRYSSKKSGTKLAYEYAVQKKKIVLNIAWEFAPLEN